MAHGSGPSFEVLASRPSAYQGEYGSLRPDLPGWQPEGVAEGELDRYFLEFANRVMIEEPDQLPRALAARDAQQRRKLDSTIPAGYTYFGQFIDHDITYDPASLTLRSDPRGSRNFRTPRLDLDSVYGRGPEDQPYLYDQRKEERGKMLIGEVIGADFKLRDLPRNAQGRALIGDMRNDENAMVSQLHLGFLLAHNALFARARARGKDSRGAFEDARRTLRWLYQYVVWNDFIPRVTNEEVHQRALRRVETGDGQVNWVLGLDRVYSWERQPFMPVEFSAAAYRFGHSMVRNEYETNRRIRGEGEPLPLFDGNGGEDPDDLRGYRPLTANNVIQWDWFLRMTSSPPGFPQMARKIDTKLANSLAYLHDEESPMNVLAFRNLKRGCAYGLPAGTALADALDIEPVRLQRGDPDALWFYILREAESQAGDDQGNRLGLLGSTIVCATVASLLKSDSSSYFNAKPSWTPNNDELLLFRGVDNIDGGEQESRRDRPWRLASIVRIAGLPISAQDVDDQVRRSKFPDPLYGMPPRDRQ